MNRFNWSWVAVIGSEEEYGQRGVQQFSKVAENMSVCVAYQGLIPVYTDPKPAVQTIINNIKTTQVKVVIVFALAEPAAIFFEQVSKGEWSSERVTQCNKERNSKYNSLIHLFFKLY